MSERTILRASQIEAAVRAAMRAGLSRVRVVVDYRAGRIEIDGAPDEDLAGPPSFDFVDFRARQ
ncbi:hypothetical protein SAMN05216257_104111 [Meinhardsimonia xiamenensis]|uniref:Uncharacterized protein n=1 Tax=Meinhardsimonia xiamenensis TaxID=990712 RepID=A0A1G9E1G1_9RHOB|nr:hypothetical protein [Meinhardsimonia xiamenensis]PRX33964.1 hypothetical protein LV81_02403 [Meinhardsimonia xiamenensis]SDK69944.1 hypothetical protein SAMN05216257_104111 [Meinhardsimonia xiamenensis]